jgi:hypothetical protein
MVKREGIGERQPAFAELPEDHHMTLSGAGVTKPEADCAARI